MSHPDAQPVGGCRWCGVLERDHAQRWHTDGKWHTWVAPTDEQRLKRTRGNRAMKAQAQEPRVLGVRQKPSRYGQVFDDLAERWARLEREHDELHPDRDECGGIGGCSLMERAVQLGHLMDDALVDWRVDHWGRP